MGRQTVREKSERERERERNLDNSFFATPKGLDHAKLILVIVNQEKSLKTRCPKQNFTKKYFFHKNSINFKEYYKTAAERLTRLKEPTQCKCGSVWMLARLKASLEDPRLIPTQKFSFFCQFARIHLF